MDDEKQQKIVEQYGTDIRDLNIANVRKWVQALRSGKYPKIDGSLADGRGSFCALGVAAKLAGIPEEELIYESFLPSKAMDWLGVEAEDPIIGTRMSVASMNDRDWSFAKIADRIEAYWIEPYQKYKHCFLKRNELGGENDPAG